MFSVYLPIYTAGLKPGHSVSELFPYSDQKEKMLTWIRPMIILMEGLPSINDCVLSVHYFYSIFT